MSKPEREIMREVHLRLGSRPDVRLWRFNAGFGWVNTSRGAAPQRFVPTGFPDLAGWVKIGGLAVWLGVECKSARGRLSKEQEAWMRWVAAAGGIYLVARSAEQVEAELDRAIAAMKGVGHG